MDPVSFNKALLDTRALAVCKDNLIPVLTHFNFTGRQLCKYITTVLEITSLKVRSKLSETGVV